MYSKHEDEIEEHSNAMVAHEEGSIFVNSTCEEKVYDVTNKNIHENIDGDVKL